MVIFGNQHSSLTIESSGDVQVAIDLSAKTRNCIDRFCRHPEVVEVHGVFFVFSASKLCTAGVTTPHRYLLQQLFLPAGSQTISPVVEFVFLLAGSELAPNCQPHGFKGACQNRDIIASAEAPAECHRMDIATALPAPSS